MTDLTAQSFLEQLAEMKLTIAQFADLTGIPLRTVYSYADGTRRMPKWMPFMLTCLQERSDEP